MHAYTSVFVKTIGLLNRRYPFDERSQDVGGGGKGGGGTEYVYIAPDVEETPEKKATRSVSAGVNAAAAAQQERASRARGVAASILTNRNRTTGSGAMTASSEGSRTLG